MRNPKCIVLQPRLNLEEAESEFQGRYLSTADYDVLVEKDTLGLLTNGQPKLVFLRNFLNSPQALQETYKSLRKLQFNRVQSSLRKKVLRGSKGQEIVLGWLDDKRTGPRRAEKTQLYPTVYGFVLAPMLACLGEGLRIYLPEVWADQLEASYDNGEKLVGGDLRSLIGAKGVSVVRANGTRRPIRDTDILPSLFSTVTVNRNAIFRSHADAKNGTGFACITTFGNFTGGELCFPRLRVAFALKPGDVLIADTNREQHGNVGPLVGDRISVICYLRSMKQRSSA
jgi:hypothetical protein